MKFRKEGWIWIMPPTILAIGWHIYSLPTKYNIFLYLGIITLPSIIGIGLLASFFRDPSRTLPDGFNPQEDILCPADGIYVAKNIEKGNLSLYIEMHLNHVHVTRVPMAATVKKIVRSNGKHHLVHFFKKTDGGASKAVKKNARAIITLENEDGEQVYYYLICGAFFRRAKPFVKTSQKLKAGERIGMIVFGSTVKITLPGTNYTIIPALGERVKAATTILCRKKRSDKI